MKHWEWSYDGSGSRNYLRVTVREAVSGYQLKMLENNSIPGLLQVHSRSLNGELSLNYDITGMSRLTDVLEGRGLSGGRSRELLTSLLEGMAGTEDYFLSCTGCLLQQEYIYLDKQGRAALVYLPLAGEDVMTQEELRRFFRELLAGALSAGADPFLMELLLYLNLPECSFAGLLARCRESEKSDGREQREGMREPLQAASEALRKEPDVAESAFKVQRPVQKGLPGSGKAQLPERGSGIAIPGAAGVEEKKKGKEEKRAKDKPVKEKSEKERPEKTSRGLFGIWGGGKRERTKGCAASERRAIRDRV